MAWQGEPLPRGRHKLELAEVRASQRARIARAMLEVVAEQGYEATTVAQVVAAARVSRNAFYEFFSDKTDCFMTLTEELGAELFQAVVEANAEPSWIGALRRGTRIYLGWWREHEFFARDVLPRCRRARRAGARAADRDLRALHRDVRRARTLRAARSSPPSHRCPRWRRACWCSRSPSSWPTRFEPAAPPSSRSSSPSSCRSWSACLWTTRPLSPSSPAPSFLTPD